MNALLSEYTGNRDNNFNLIRFIAAFLVLLSHSYAVAIGPGEAIPLRSFIGMTWGMIAVDIFFVISGFLVAGSFFSRRNISSFIWARILRIYPALVVAVLICVFAVGLYFTVVPAQEYLSSPQVRKYFFKNTFLFFGVEHRLPGVFNQVPFKYVVNGSLWTLTYEVKMYACLAIVGTVMLYLQNRTKANILKIAFLSIAAVAVFVNIFNHFQLFASVKLTHLLSMFFSGVVFYVCRDHVCLHWKMFVLALMAISLSLFHKEIFFVVYSLALPYLLLYVAYVPAGRIRIFNRVGDYSYGIYIYAFPVQQSIAVLIPGVSVAIMIVLSAGVTFVLAFLSWNLIEKKCLKLRQKADKPIPVGIRSPATAQNDMCVPPGIPHPE